MSEGLQNVLAIGTLLAVIALVLARLPKVDVGHSKEFTRRRFLNWFPLGLTYSFLYMGRYNLTVAKNALGDLMTIEDFGHITAAGSIVYGVAFVINGPLADRIGGRRTTLIAAAGAAIANLLMGAVLLFKHTSNLGLTYMILYSLNMYFQSFGAVSIVKVNAHWFHLRERGSFGGIFGILISLGIYFAFDWGKMIVTAFPVEWVFFIPAAILLVFFVIDYFLVHDTPSETGHPDFDTADATWGGDGPRLSVWVIGKMMLTNRTILTIAAIEFCSGFVRKSMMDWYSVYATKTGIADTLLPAHWGLVQCIAGILGGVLAGLISDRVFGARRGPVAVMLYGVMFAGSIAAFFALGYGALGWIVVVMMLSVIGVHGMLSGTASMDFGGKKNVGVAVGLIDGFVYLGVGAQALFLGNVLPDGAAAANPLNWKAWPLAMAPVALVGFLLATRLWNARPQNNSAAH
ncbi:MAG: MFS transporter [Sandaracinaceae bacterium]|nr:MFS transporter [Sandaracinaceae bacterium]